MGIFPWTVGLLSIIILLFWAQSNRLTEDVYIQNLIKNNLFDESHRLFSKISYNASEKFRQLAKPPDNTKSTSPQLTSRLHLYSISTHMSKTDQDVQKELFLKLINILYARLPIFDADPRKNEHLVEELFIEAFDYLSKPENRPKKRGTVSLSKAQFEDPHKEIKRDRFFHMLNGANGEILPKYPSVIPRLYDFFTTDKYQNGRYLATPFTSKEPVLLTLFDSQETVAAILQRRESIDQELQGEGTEEKIGELSQQFEEEFSSHLHPGINPKSIDFTVKKLSKRSS